MKVIIAGSRDFNNWRIFLAFTNYYLQNIPKHELEIVSGGASGADSCGSRYAINNNFKLKIFKPEWDKYGKKAGILRNIQMGDYSDCLIAFWDGKSHGTSHMINYMTSLKKPSRIVLYNDPKVWETIVIKEENYANKKDHNN